MLASLMKETEATRGGSREEAPFQDNSLLPSVCWGSKLTTLTSPVSFLLISVAQACREALILGQILPDVNALKSS